MTETTENIIRTTRQKNLFCRWGVHSILGTRDYQQDFAYVAEDAERLLAVVCDGMGGLEGGELASKTAAERLGTAFDELTDEDYPAFFKDAAIAADRDVSELRGRNGQPLKAGTTLAAVLIAGNRMYGCSVGDSRIWIIRDDVIVPVNRDHNYELTLKLQLQSGKITREKFEKEKQTKRTDALTSFIGMNGLAYLDINAEPFYLQDGDRIIVCSDGVYKCLNEAQVKAIVCDNDMDLSLAAEKVNYMAERMKKGSQDNTTVIVLDYSRQKSGSEA